MQNFIVMTDSCCDLNAQEVAELGIRVLPLTFMVDGESYRDTPDHAELSLDEFYSRLRAGAECSTSAVSVGDFLAAMREELEGGRDVLCVCFSSALSTTYQSACIAAEDLRAEFPDRTIEVIDSLSASRGQGMLIWRAVKELREKDLSLAETADFIRREIPRQCHWFTVEDLNQLKRGGRVSATAALFGTMLSIKPVLHTDPQGRLIPKSKARGMKAALTQVVDAMERLGVPPLSEQTVFICHAACPDYVSFVSGLLRERFGVTDIRADFIGPVIGSHTGAGTLGLFFVGSER